MFKLVLEKAEEPEIKLPPSDVWIIKKVRKFQKNIYFCFIDSAKDFGKVNKAEKDVIWISLAFSMIQRMLAISSLVPLSL